MMKAKQLILKSLKLKNFKGIKELFIPVNLVTNISGDNATGKTTINDAATYLLFGKDSQGRTDFDIQPLDSQNQTIHYLDTEVEAVFEADGKQVTLRKVLNEKWQKPTGKSESVLKGTTTSYYIDEVPQKLKEYSSYINELVDEKLFKLLTSPFTFEGLPWKEKRALLFEMCGDVSDEDVCSSNEKLQKLMNVLDGKSIEDFKKIVAQKKKKLKDDFEKLPARIDELSSSLEEIDVVATQAELKSELDKFNQLEEQLEASNNAFEETRRKQQQIISFETQFARLKRESLESSMKEVNEKKHQAIQLEAEINSLKSDITRFENTIDGWLKEILANDDSVKGFEVKVSELRNSWVKEDAIEFTFDPSKGVCPHCGQTLPLEKYSEAEEAARAHFDKAKAEKLEAIKDSANSYNNRISELRSFTEGLNTRVNKGRQAIRDNMLKLEELEPQLKQLNEDLANSQINQEEITVETADMKAIKQDITLLQEEVACAISADTSDLKARKSEIQSHIDGLKAKLVIADENIKKKNRISELEQQEFLTEEFTRAKVDMLEDKINSRFKYVKFKLFNQQVNGGIAECCESLINGVPFSSANNAAKFNAGLDIINALVDYYGFSAPIFIDNAESVNELIHTESQVIRLVVSHDKQLVIS